MSDAAPPVRRAERKRQEQAAEMRADIVDAAFTEFVERGYHPTAIADIARRLGVSQGTFYNYFTGKRQIVEHVFDDLVRRITAILGADNPPDAPTTLEDHREQARRIAGAVDAIADTDPRVLRMLLLEATSVDAELTERVLGLFDLAQALGSAYLHNGVQRGIFRADLDIAGTSDAITGMVIGVALRTLRSEPDAAARHALHESVVRLLFDGVAA